MLARLSIATLGLCALLGSCATPASPTGMTLGDRELSKLITRDVDLGRLPSLRVRNVTGGSETSSMGSPQVSAQDFERALRDSLLYLDLQPLPSEPALDLDAELLDLELPVAAFDMPAFLTVRYRVHSADSALVFDHTIRTGYMVPCEAAFTGVDRARLAIEGAARDNFTELLLSLWKDLGFVS